MLRLSLCLIAVLVSVAMIYAEEVSLGGLKSNTPDSWKSAPPNSNFRKHQFSIPKVKDDTEDAEIVVFKEVGGGVADNLKRWKSMFEAPEGKSIDDIAKLETFKVGKSEVTYLDITGTFLSKFPPFAPNAKVTKKANYRRIGVILDIDGSLYFITLNGPAATVGAAKADFDSWLKNFK